MVYFCLLFTFVLISIKIFHSLGNTCPQSLKVIEDYILSAAISLSHGKNLDSVIDNLHSEIKASEDAQSRKAAPSQEVLGTPGKPPGSNKSKPKPSRGKLLEIVSVGILPLLFDSLIHF